MITTTTQTPGHEASRGRGKRAPSDNKRSERRLAWLLCAPAALVMLAVTGWPIIYSIWLSLQRYDLKFPDEREFIGLDNYVSVLTNQYWWSAFAVTMLITIVSVAIELVLGMALALVMHRALIGRGLVRTSVLIPYGIVTVVAAFSWRYAWTPDTGYLANLFTPESAPLTDRTRALAIVILAEVWKTTPFMALLLLAGLALVPDDLHKAAAVDGATAWQRFIRVTVPVMKPAILVALLVPHPRCLPHLRQHLRAHRWSQRDVVGVDTHVQQPAQGPQPGHRFHDVGAGLHHRGHHRLRLHQAVRHLSAGWLARGETMMAGPSPGNRGAAVWRWGLLDAIVVMYALVPVLWIVSLSLKTPATLTDGRFIPRDWTLENYRTIFSTDEFLRALGNSIGIALIATFIAVTLGMLAAYAIARLDFPGRGLLVGVALLIAMFPQVSLVSPLFEIERNLGLFDTWLGLILPYVTFALPLAIYTLSAFFRQIPWDLEKAAKMDGATQLQAFRRVIAPLAAPGVVTAAILVFIFCWNDFLFAISLTSTERARTVPAALSFFTGASQFEDPTGSVSAAAVVITIPIVLFVLLFQRRIVAGLTAGAVKG